MKLAKKEEDDDDEKPKCPQEGRKYVDSLAWKKNEYALGQFVLVQKDNTASVRVAEIRKLWEDQKGEGWIEVQWFYRPSETNALGSSGIDAKEVFLSSEIAEIPIAWVVNKCMVKQKSEVGDLRAYKKRDVNFFYQHFYDPAKGELRSVASPDPTTKIKEGVDQEESNDN